MSPPSNFEPVSPIDLTAHSKRSRRSVGFNISAEDLDEKSDVKASTRSIRTNSTASTRSSTAGGNQPTVRRARFAEATSVFSPASGPGESQSPFADPPSKMEGASTSEAPKPSDVGFGYISENQPVEQHAYIRTDPNGAAGGPLKSALKTPGTASRMLNPLSPTFREEQLLEKEEMKTDEQQANDLVSPSHLETKPSFTNNLITESQNPSPHGQDGPPRRQLLVLLDRPRHAFNSPNNLPRNKESPQQEQPPRLGTPAETLASNRRPQHRLRLVIILHYRHHSLLPGWPPPCRESRRLLHHVRGRLVLVQHCHVARRRGRSTRQQDQQQRAGSVGLVLQGQQAAPTVQG